MIDVPIDIFFVTLEDILSIKLADDISIVPKGVGVDSHVVPPLKWWGHSGQKITLGAIRDSECYLFAERIVGWIVRVDVH